MSNLYQYLLESHFASEAVLNQLHEPVNFLYHCQRSQLELSFLLFIITFNLQYIARIVCLLWASHYCQNFRCIILFHLRHNPMRALKGHCYNPHSKKAKLSHRLSKLQKILSQMVRVETRFKTRQSESRICALKQYGTMSHPPANIITKHPRHLSPKDSCRRHIVLIISNIVSSVLQTLLPYG